MTTENKVSIHFQMMLKNHFSCYAVIKATYQSFHSNTALDSVPMLAIWLMLSTYKYTQFHFMITNFHYLIAVYSVSLDMLFECWYRYLFIYEKEQERSFADSTGLPLWSLSINRNVSPWWKIWVKFYDFPRFLWNKQGTLLKLSAWMISWTVKMWTADSVEDGTHMKAAFSVGYFLCWRSTLT